MWIFRCPFLQNLRYLLLQAITLPVVPKNHAAHCSKSRCPLLWFSLPVALNFVARRFLFCCPSLCSSGAHRFLFCCPWKFTPLPVVFLCRRAWKSTPTAVAFFRPFWFNFYSVCVSFALTERKVDNHPFLRALPWAERFWRCIVTHFNFWPLHFLAERGEYVALFLYIVLSI